MRLILGLSVSAMVLDPDSIENINDYALFTCRSSRGLTILLLYVDDMIITRYDVASIIALKKYLQ